MKKVILAVLLSGLFTTLFAQDSLTVSAVSRAQRIDTIKAALVAPDWVYNHNDTTYIKRNASVTVRLRWYNPGTLKMVDTTVIWRATELGIDTYRYVPRLKLHFVENK